MATVRHKPTKNQLSSVGGATPPLPIPREDSPVMLAMIQAVIPLGLRAVEDALQAEVTAFAGARYARGDGVPGVVRWSQKPGSISLADQKLPVTVPRVRDQGQHRARCRWRPISSCKPPARMTTASFAGCWGASPAASTKRRRKPCRRRSG